MKNILEYLTIPFDLIYVIVFWLRLSESITLKESFQIYLYEIWDKEEPEVLRQNQQTSKNTGNPGKLSQKQDKVKD